ncbi:MAG: hypothetical protein AAF741_18525 [Bacteroidota bacterium]
MFILILYSTFFSPPTHDVSMAMFRLSAAENGLDLQIDFDKADYLYVSGLHESTIDIQGFQDYLDRTTSWIIDEKECTAIVRELSTERDHVQVKCFIETASSKHTEFSIYNEFLNGIEDQSNVIILELHDQSRGFRMHNDRTQITISY